jgi:hypothetical protein
MSVRDIRINASVTRRVKSKDGYDEATLGISQVPADSTDEDMRLALHAGLHLLDLIGDEISSRLRLSAPVVPVAQVPSLFVAEPDPVVTPTPVVHPPKRRAETVSETPTTSPAEDAAKIVMAGLDHKAELAERVAAIKDVSLTQTSIYVGDPEDLPPPADPPQAAPIPKPSEVELSTPFTNVLGIGIRIPEAEDPRWWEQITEKNRDGTGHGQLMAINAALTARGFKGNRRHLAISTILNGIEFTDERSRTKVDVESTKELSVAQASIVLEWLDQAEDVCIDRLSAAIGSPPLALDGEEL